VDKERVQFALRIEQLDFRRHEVHIAYSTFCDFLEKAGPSVNLETIDGSEVDHSWTLIDDETKLTPIKYREHVSLVGHSFGGCTAVKIDKSWMRNHRLICGSFLSFPQSRLLGTRKYQQPGRCFWIPG